MIAACCPAMPVVLPGSLHLKCRRGLKVTMDRWKRQVRIRTIREFWLLILNDSALKGESLCVISCVHSWKWLPFLLFLEFKKKKLLQRCA